MITAVAHGKDGEKIIVLGITAENVTRLMKGMPIRVTPESHPGFPKDVVILITFGQTEKAITEQLAPLISGETKIIGVPRSTCALHGKLNCPICSPKPS